jgi:hypothetical protein
VLVRTRLHSRQSGGFLPACAVEMLLPTSGYKNIYYSHRLQPCSATMRRARTSIKGNY